MGAGVDVQMLEGGGGQVLGADRAGNPNSNPSSRPDTAAKRVLDGVQVFSLAESLGGVESLISHPASMTHGAVPEDRRNALGITAGLVRISVGIEDAADLVEDLRSGLD